MAIDLHNHIYHEEFFDGVSARFADYRPRYVHLGGNDYRIEIKGWSFSPVWPSLFSLKQRFADMERMGVAMHALSVAPFMFWHHFDRDLQIEFSRSQNDHIAALVREYPKRFAGVATVPLASVPDAVAELERAVKQLGMRAVEIPSNVNGMYLDDKQLWPFYAKAEELGVLIYVHPWNVAADDKLSRYYMLNTIGNPLDSTIAISCLVFGGVLAEFPRLHFYFVHAGGFAPYQRGRFEHAWEVRPEPKSFIRTSPSGYFKQLHFDTLTFYQPALQFLVESAGVDNVSLGTDYPFDMQDFTPVESVRALNLPEADKRKILHDNAARLLGLS